MLFILVQDSSYVFLAGLKDNQYQLASVATAKYQRLDGLNN